MSCDDETPPEAEVYVNGQFAGKFPQSEEEDALAVTSSDERKMKVALQIHSSFSRLARLDGCRVTADDDAVLSELAISVRNIRLGTGVVMNRPAAQRLIVSSASNPTDSYWQEILDANWPET